MCAPQKQSLRTRCVSGSVASSKDATGEVERSVFANVRGGSLALSDVRRCPNSNTKSTNNSNTRNSQPQNSSGQEQNPISKSDSYFCLIANDWSVFRKTMSMVSMSVNKFGNTLVQFGRHSQSWEQMLCSWLCQAI